MKKMYGFIGSLLVAAFAAVFVFTILPARAAVNQAITVAITGDVVVNNDGQCSLREAIIAANTNAPSGVPVGECRAGEDSATDVITLADGAIYTLDIIGNGEDNAATGDLDILDDLPLLDVQFVVENEGSATINASAGNDRVFHILGAGVEFNNITITGGDAKIGTFAVPGGGIYNDNGNLTINGGVISSNTASYGGGIYNNGTTIGKGQVTLNDVDVILNNATTNSRGGGGLASFGSRGVVSLTNDTLIRANSSANEGGGIYMDDGALTVDGSTINLNTADGGGGGIRAATAATVTITDSTMDSNQAQNQGYGGAVYAGSADISGSTFQSNSGFSGGALFLSAAADATNITNSVFIDNSASSGGAIRAQKISAANIRVENNQASVDGGGLYLAGTPAKEIVNSVVISNTADAAGGGIYVAAGDVDISQTAVAYNDAADGGGIWTDSNGTFVSNSTISNNAAKNGGGVYIELTGAMTITNVTIAFSVSADQDVYKMGDLTLQNSVIYTPGTDSCLGSVSKPQVISLGDNLTDDNTCLGLTESGDEVNATVGLAPLADNGGGTLTHALLDGSPALDTANAAACAASPVNGVDQRGILRPLGAGCDKGAFERGAVVFLPVIVK